MPAISDQARFIIWILVGIAGFLASGLGILLGPNIAYYLRQYLPGEPRQGGIPTRRSHFSWILLVLCTIVTVVGTAVASSAPEWVDLLPMTGDYRVVVSPFKGDGTSEEIQISEEVARNSFLRIQRDLNTSSPDLIITLWGPDDLKAKNIQAVSGKTPGERAVAAATLAEAIGADLILYGVIEKQGDGYSIRPEFYINARNFYEAEDIAGQYALGSTFSMHSLSDLSDRLKAGSELSVRIQAMSKIILGLAFYASKDYTAAFQEFQAADSLDGWSDDQGKHILYLLAGNAAIRPEPPNLELAQRYYQKALNIQPDYARGLVGLANTYYRQALIPVAQSGDPSLLDKDLIDQALHLLDLAMQSKNQSLLADVPTKIHFEKGQCLFSLAWGEYLPGYDTAIVEFKKVIADYENGDNLRLKERAAEAHARLGLIYSLSGYEQEAISEYEIAVTLLENHPSRQALFQERIKKLEEAHVEPTQPSLETQETVK